MLVESLATGYQPYKITNPDKGLQLPHVWGYLRLKSKEGVSKILTDFKVGSKFI